MKSPLIYRLGLAAIALAAVGVIAITATPDAVTADESAYKPVMSVKDVMNAVNHEEHGVYGMIKAWADTDPAKGDKNWKIMGYRAKLLSEAGNILAHLAPPKGTTESWAQKAADFKKDCGTLKIAFATRNLDKLKAGLASVRAKCDACHDAHRPE